MWHPPAKNNPKVIQRIAIGKKRIVSVLKTNGACLIKTLEQKIADAGPSHMRVDPALLTYALKEVISEGVVTPHLDPLGSWFHLTTDTPAAIKARLAKTLPVWKKVSSWDLHNRIGQALEIAIFKALQTAPYSSSGGFLDLDKHADDTNYKREEVSRINKKNITQNPLDFLAYINNDIAGIEAKNTREWYYPDNTDHIAKFLLKCTDMDVVPVFIARRVSYVAFSEILHPCGVIVHETYNQRYPVTAATLAAKAAHKRLLGFHDIRASNEPDDRLIRFLHQTLPSTLTEARKKFDANKDLLQALATKQIDYKEFHVQLRIRLGIYSPYEPDEDSE